MREPARQPPLGGFSLHSVDDGVAYFQHEHDTASPIPFFNIFVARPGATQFLAAFVDGPIDPSGGLITGYTSAERDGCELCFARTARVPLAAHIWTSLHQNIGTSTACPSANHIPVLSPYFENRSQNSWNSIASVPSTYATRFNDIDTPVAIF